MSETHSYGPEYVDKTLYRPPFVHSRRCHLQAKEQTMHVSRTWQCKATKHYRLTSYNRRFLDRLGARGTRPPSLVLRKQSVHSKPRTFKPKQTRARYHGLCRKEQKTQTYDAEREIVPTIGVGNAACSSSAASAGAASESDSSLSRDFLIMQGTSRDFQCRSDLFLRT